MLPDYAPGAASVLIYRADVEKLPSFYYLRGDNQTQDGMKKIYYSLFALSIMIGISACGPQKDAQAENGNTILAESKAPFGAPEFDKFKIEDYKEAFDIALDEKRADVKAIIENSEEPTFANTIDALEMSGKTLDRVSAIFFNLNESENTPQMTEIEEYVVPKLTELSGYIFMNDTLFGRIRTLYDKRGTLGLDEEQMIVLDNYYQSFVRGGALLNEEEKAALLEIDKQIGLAQIKFSSNLLADNKAFTLVITDKDDLSGLPQNVIDAAAPKSPAELVPSISKAMDLSLFLESSTLASNSMLSFPMTSLNLTFVYFKARRRPIDAYVFCTLCSLNKVPGLM